MKLTLYFIFRRAYIRREICVGELGGLYAGGGLYSGAYIRDFTVFQLHIKKFIRVVVSLARKKCETEHLES